MKILIWSLAQTVAESSLRLPSRDYFSNVVEYLSCAAIKMARNIQPSHRKDKRRGKEEREESPTKVIVWKNGSLIISWSLAAIFQALSKGHIHLE